MEKDIKKQSLTEGTITKLIFKLSLPMIIAQVINLLYNMVDRIYIGNYNGEEGLIAIGGVGACFPIIIIISAFASLFGMGGSPLAAIALGNKDREKSEKILNHSVILLTIIAVILIPILFIFKEDILYAFGANSKNIKYANEYLNIYIIGTLFVMFSLGLNQYITCQGKALFAMASVIIGAVLNIALDPLFIYTFDMGVQGAALATIISQCVSALWVLTSLFGKKTTLRIHHKHMKPSMKVLGPVLALGLAPFIMQSTEGLLNICFNSSLQKYGGVYGASWLY